MVFRTLPERTDDGTNMRNFRSLWVLALLAALPPASACRRSPVEPAGLAVAAPAVEAPAGAGERLAALLDAGGPDLAKACPRGAINTLLPAGAWAGRVRESGVSQQALFAVDDMAVEFAARGPLRRRLAFSVFHAGPGPRTYRVILEANGRRWRAFERRAAQRQTFSAEVALDPGWRRFRVRLETRGRGLGAWVNPRLLGRRGPPRVFVLIVLDSVRADHTSLLGYGRRTTPELERLGREGRVFRQAFSTTSWTLPAHVSLFSGRDLPGHRVLGPADRIGDDVPLLAEVFQKNGFATAAFTGGGFVSDHYGFHRGFQVYANNPGNVFSMDSAERVLRNFRHFADGHWGEDLFVFLHTYQAHAPYKFPSRLRRAVDPGLSGNLLGPGNFLGASKTAVFAALPDEARQQLIGLYDTAIFYADQALVGGVVRILKEKGAWERATVAVASDHGEEFFDHGSWEHGHSLYGEVLRVPLVIKYAGGRRSGVENGLTSLADLPALLLDGAGLATPPGFPPAAGDGGARVLESALPVSPIIEGIPAKASFVDERFHFIYNDVAAGAAARFDPPPPPLRAHELYDRRDAAERRDLAGARPPELKPFLDRLAPYLRRLRQARRSGGAIDEGLRQELRSLGYLGD
jgi:arylsulfatase A-like enzyme